MKFKRHIFQSVFMIIMIAFSHSINAQQMTGFSDDQFSSADQWLGASNQSGDIWRSGKVGIGMSGDVYLPEKLNVEGNIRVTGDIKGYETSSTFNLFANTTDANGPYIRMYGTQGEFRPGALSFVANNQGAIRFFSKTASSWAQHLTIKNNGKVAIGTENTPDQSGSAYIGDYRLFVKGGILSDAVRVRSDWADYVFSDNYALMPLNKVENHIAQHGRLHNTISAKEVETEGLDVAKITTNQQEKIEELFLHLIEMNKEIALLKSENKALQAKFGDLTH